MGEKNTNGRDPLSGEETQPGANAVRAPVYRGFSLGSALMLVDREFVRTTYSSSNYVVIAIEMRQGGEAKSDFEAYDSDLTGAQPIELRFGGERVTAEHALAMARDGIRILLTPALIDCFEVALLRLGEYIKISFTDGVVS